MLLHIEIANSFATNIGKKEYRQLNYVKALETFDHGRTENRDRMERTHLTERNWGNKIDYIRIERPSFKGKENISFDQESQDFPHKIIPTFAPSAHFISKINFDLDKINRINRVCGVGESLNHKDKARDKDPVTNKNRNKNLNSNTNVENEKNNIKQEISKLTVKREKEEEEEEEKEKDIYDKNNRNDVMEKTAKIDKSLSVFHSKVPTIDKSTIITHNFNIK